MNPQNIKKTLLFLEQYFPERLEFSFDYLKALLVHKSQYLPALVIHVQEGEYNPINSTVLKWLQTVNQYAFDALPPPLKRNIEIGGDLRLRYLHDPAFQKLTDANIYNVLAFVNSNSPSIDEQEVKQMKIITLPKSPVENPKMEELLVEIPEFLIFLQK